MRRLTLVIALLASVTGLLLVPGVATAKKKKAKSPQVTSVSPMRVKPRANLSIRGRNFSRSRRRNTVIFAVGRRSIFVKPSRASSRRLVVKVPVSLERLMRRDDAGLKSTRFTIKVAAGRKFSRKTPRRLSPVVVPLTKTQISVPGPSGAGGSGGTGGSDTPFVPSDDCDNDGTPNSSDDSSDADLLNDSLERTLRTDPCNADTDGDGAEDGFEYRSALDLNHFPRTPPLPFPGKRPYPNALDPTDGSTDYDGDSLTVREEFLAWFRYSDDGVRRPGRPGGNIVSPATFVLYSDGLQKSKDPAPAAPGGALANWALDLDESGNLWDDERDVDGDGLSNYDEQHGQFTEAWWPAQHNGDDCAEGVQVPGHRLPGRRGPPRAGRPRRPGHGRRRRVRRRRRPRPRRPDQPVRGTPPRRLVRRRHRRRGGQLPQRTQSLGVHEPVQPLQAVQLRALPLASAFRPLRQRPGAPDRAQRACRLPRLAPLHPGRLSQTRK